MRKVLLAVASLFMLVAAKAQTGKNQFGVEGDIGIGTASGSKVSYGASAKYLNGVGNSAQTTFSLGFLKSSTSEEINGVKYKTSTTLIPLLVGYRQRLSAFYVEPQAGLSINTNKSTSNGVPDNKTKLAFAYAIGAGYITEGGFDLGVRFFNTTQSGSKGMFIFHVGYNFTLGR